MSYDRFEERLKGADWEGRVRLSLQGIRGNILTKRLWQIGDLNLQTLEISFPEAYEAVKDRRTRESLILAGLFEASPWKGTKENLELTFPSRDRLASTLRGLRGEEVAYRGGDAVKVLIKSLYILHDEVRSTLSWPILADPWRAEDEDRAAKLKSIMEEVLPKRHAGMLVYCLWYDCDQLKRARKRLSKLLNMALEASANVA